MPPYCIGPIEINVFSGTFRCDSGQCIAASLACNGENNCGDLSDERSCGNGFFLVCVADCYGVVFIKPRSVSNIWMVVGT